MLNWNLIIDLLIELLYNFATSLSGYMVGAKVLGWPEPAAWLVAVLFGFIGLANHWRALRKTVPPILVLALLGGCATLEKAQADIQSVVAASKLDLSQATLADVDMAIEMARVATDAGAPYRKRCYETLRKYVPSASVATPPVVVKGVVSAYEKIAELDAQVRSGISLVPPEVHYDCAGISVNALEFAGRVGLKFAPIPGVPTVGGLVR